MEEEDEPEAEPVEGRVATGWMDSASRYLYGKKQPERPSAGPQTHHEGPLLKKGGKGLSPFAAEYKSRYFVMVGPKLYYFNSWEDYGSQGITAATNYKNPVQLAEYMATPVRGDPLKFDLVPTENPVSRTWELMAGSVQEAKEWTTTLRMARDAELSRRSRLEEKSRATLAEASAVRSSGGALGADASAAQKEVSGVAGPSAE